MVRSNNHKEQFEKSLEADIYVNRNRTVVRAEFRQVVASRNRQMLLGQPAAAGLSIPSRIYGFCGGAHQQAAARALEALYQSPVPRNALLLRLVTQGAEILQNTSRWFYTTMAPDLLHSSHADSLLYPELCERFTPFKGSAFRPGIMAGAQPIALYSLLAGQWPNADFVVPGGVAGAYTASELDRALGVIGHFKTQWLEKHLLHCSLERYLEIDTWEALLEWLMEKETHRRSDLGLFIRAALEFGWDGLGSGPAALLSHGAFWEEGPGLSIIADNPATYLAYDPDALNKIRENSFTYQDLLNGYGDRNPNCYQREAEVGSLARMALAGGPERKDQAGYHGLIRNVLEKKGISVFTRVLARLHEACHLYALIVHWLQAVDVHAPFALPVNELENGNGLGLTESPRGALAHYVELKKGVFSEYRIISPNTLNVRSEPDGQRTSPLAAAVEGMQLQRLEQPVEIGVVARSMDSCQVCYVKLFKSSSGRPIDQIQV